MVHSDRRRQIEAAAGRLFSRRGYAGTSMRDIARELDLQGGSLYAHIASKEDLLWELIEEAGRRFLDGAAGVLAVPADPSERLHGLIRNHLEVVTDPDLFAAVFLEEWKFLSEERRAEVLQLRDDYEWGFVQVLTEGAAAGTFEIPDVGLAVRYLLSALNGVPVWYRPGGSLEPATIADHYTDLFLSGILTPAVAAGESMHEGAGHGTV